MESLLPLLCVVLSLSVAAAHPFGLPNCTLRTISQNVRLEQTKCALANLFTVHRQVDHFGYDAWVNDTFEQRYFTYDFSAEPGRRSRAVALPVALQVTSGLAQVARRSSFFTAATRTTLSCAPLRTGRRTGRRTKWEQVRKQHRPYVAARAGDASAARLRGASLLR